MLHRLCLFAPLFATPALGQTALYDAGTAGNPATAPDPTTQGWTLVDPSGGQVTLSALSPDPGTGLNAWHVDDQVTFNGGRAHYAQLFSPAEITDAANNGWELTVEARIVASTGVDIFAEFASGTGSSDDRYLVFFSVSGTDVVVDVFLAGIPYTCVGGNDGNYHTYTIRKPAGPANVDAEFLFDGVSLGPLPRGASNGNAPDGGVHWGSGSSGATATANFHRVEFGPLGPATIGTNYCTAVANSTGSSAVLSATGSSVAADNNLTLRTTEMPANAFGFFLTSQTQGLVAMPGGSQGNLCLGGAIGRYVGSGQIQSSGNAGEISLVLDLTQHPTPTGLVSVQAGETWNFTSWYRDTSGGAATSNFSDGLEVDFQ